MTIVRFDGIFYQSASISGNSKTAFMYQEFGLVLCSHWNWFSMKANIVYFAYVNFSQRMDSNALSS